jgi:predicted unusual protein kinase regulating ubiquinone biosynthesis (AarF/ABC1/UbiB family)
MARPAERDGIATGRVRRAVPVAGMAARTAGESVLARLRRVEPTPEEYARRAERYVELLGRSKGALMKAGQLMSFVSFTASVPEENRALFQAAMSRLQTSAPPMAPELATEVVELELGQAPERLFAEFDASPLAAASIGQVHAARMHDGTPVAVKIQYPGVGAAIAADLKNTELLGVMFQLMRSFVPGLTRSDPRSMAAEISERITEELDYRIEARNQTLFADAYRGHPFIHVPRVMTELSSERVLTQELATGARWNEALQAPEDLRNTWAEVIHRFFFGGMRRLNAFYADPHPGNYLFREDGGVSFLDFGCVKHFTPAQIADFTDIVRSIVGDDPEALREVFVRQGVFDDRTGPSAEDIVQWYRGPFELFTSPQPFLVTPEWLARMIEVQYSPTGPSGSVVRSLQPPGEFVFLSRIDLGLMSVLAELRACHDWRAIEQEMDFGAGPATALGEAEAAFWTSPTGSEHR